jgi:hypothetical protein
MQDSNWEDYYQTLGVDSEANPQEIRHAYRALVMDYHPDRQTGATAAVLYLAEEKLKEINRAYEVLGDPQNRQRYHAEWLRRGSPPKPLADPAHLLFGNVVPGEVQTGSFTIRNQGGSYTRLWFSNPGSWVRVTDYASLSDNDELPLRVEVEAEGREWGKSYYEAITVRLDNVETTVQIELRTRPAPVPTPTYAPSSPPYAAPTYHTPTVAIPRRRQRSANRRLVLSASLALAIAVILAVAWRTVVVLQDLRPWERPVWSTSLPGYIRATPLDANADQVMDEMAMISWWTRGATAYNFDGSIDERYSDSIKLTVKDKQGNVKSSKTILSRGDHFPISFDSLELYPIDYDSDGVINELYLYVENAEWLIEYAFSTVLTVFSANGEILWQWTCHTYVSNGWTATPAPTCSENEITEKHRHMLTEYVNPVHNEVQNYPQTAKDWKHIVRIKDGTVGSYPGRANLTYSLSPWWAEDRNSYGGDPSVSPDGKLTALVKPSGNWYYGFWFEISIIDTVMQETLTSTTMSSGGRHDGVTMTWSPDGRKLALQATQNLITVITANVKIIDLASGDQFDIGCRYEGSKLVWSRDSVKLAFEGRQCRSSEQYSSAEKYTNYVYEYNVNTKELTILALGRVRYGM